MRNAFFILFCFITLLSHGQNNKTNELKLNGAFILAVALDISYEKLLSQETSAGAAFLLSYGNKEAQLDYTYYLSPYYRFFFGNKYASGFFIETFGMLNSSDRNVKENGIYKKKEKHDFAIGFGSGAKWVSKSGFIFELNFGVGRNLLIQNADSNIVGKANFNIGFRY